MSDFVSVDRINSLKSGIEAKTGEAYADLTEGVQALMDGYGQGGGGGETSDDVLIRIPSYSDVRALSNDVYLKFNTNMVYNNLFDGYPYLNNVVVDFSVVDMQGLEAVDNNFYQNQYWFRGTTSANGINLTLVGGKNPYFWAGVGCFASPSMKNINGAKIKIGSWINTTVNTFYNAKNLVNVEFYENFMENDWFLQWCGAFNDASIVSLANALRTATHTLNLHATPKSRCDEITGSVSQKTAEDGTVYDFFTADSSGTVTLTEFITNTKGWTLA